MQTYRNLGGKSGIAAFSKGGQSITVRFREGRHRDYTYTYASAGRDHVETMKRLADEGRGLNAYIDRFARENYASRS